MQPVPSIFQTAYNFQVCSDILSDHPTQLEYQREMVGQAMT